jgi:DNA helicase-2/ATP-dependent DNA helicase PcrA
MLHDHARKSRIPLTEAARNLSATDAMKPKPRRALSDLIASFDRWRGLKDTTPHTRLAEIVLDESGYTEMWKNDRSPDAPGRLENLKELVKAIEEFETLPGFLEHVGLRSLALRRDERLRLALHDARLAARARPPRHGRLRRDRPTALRGG